MKKFFSYYGLSCFALLLSLWQPSAAQVGQWAWMSGSDTFNSPGSYGLTNPVPSARSEVFSWADNSGNLWLFGGYANATSSATSIFSDMWKYNLQSSNWALVSGSNGSLLGGVWGTQGVAAPANTPGNRSRGASWKDVSGNFWLFGGYGVKVGFGSGYFNDLWKYDVATGNWAWMKGSTGINSTGTYGTIGVADAANTPRARGSAVRWTDKNGNPWLFGGITSLTPSTNVYTGDLWKYNTGTNNWTWMGGGVSQSGNWGVQGVPATANTPGARAATTAWTDTSGNLWLYGGAGYGTTGNGSLLGQFSDLWKYDIGTGMWTWMSGSNLINQQAVYGVQGVSSAGNTPGRLFNAAAWADTSSNLWLFGGTNGTYSNDLWKYSIATGNWAWMKGSGGSTINPPGIYGTQGVAAPGNNPGGRTTGTAWIGSDGGLWLFGGTGLSGPGNVGCYNDLWKYNTNNTPLPLTLAHFLATKEAGTARLRWQTSYEHNIASFTIERNSDGHSYIQIGAVAASGNTSLAHSYSFTDASPSKGPNYYRISITEKDGRVSYSEIRLLSFGGNFGIALFPNPAKSKVVLTGVEAGMSIRTISATGQTVATQKATGNTIELPVTLLPAGLYQVQVYDGNGKLLGSTTMARE